MRRHHRALFFSIAALLLCLASGIAGAAELAPKVRVTILMTTLSYDLNLKSRGDSLRIGVVSLKGNAKSKQHAAAAMKAFDAASSKRVKGLSLTAVTLPIADGKGLEGAIKAESINILYLSSDLGRLRAEAIKLAKQYRFLAICGEAEAVAEGAAIGVVQEGRKPRILINLKAAKAQGANLDARLLRLVKVVQ